MDRVKIDLWNGEVPAVDGVEVKDLPEFYYYPAVTKDKQRGVVLVLPGGGYGNHADHEGHSIAGWLNSQGIHAYVLKYRVSPHRQPTPLADVQRAVRVIRSLADKYEYKDKVGVLGFSAGGHLTATAVTMFERKTYDSKDEADKLSARPDCGVLCYPVVDSGEYAHQGSYKNLLGEEHTEELRQEWNPLNYVSADTPPCFLWHTFEDPGVPVQNSLLFGQKLADNKVPFEMHVYPEGPHGIGGHNLDYYDICRSWLSACEKWLIKQGV